MYKIAILLSGNGSNFEAIVNYFKKIDDIEVALCISNNRDAFGIKRAEKLGIEYKIFDLDEFKTREQQERQIAQTLKKNNIDLVILAGYMLLLKFELLDWSKKMINLHPSLLPKYPGKSAIKETFFSNDEKGGITIHYVDAGMDTGKIIEQFSIDIDRSKGIEIFEKEIHSLEWEYFPKVIEKIIRSI